MWFIGDDDKAAVWTGAIGGLWSLDKPVIKGDLWLDTQVKADEKFKMFVSLSRLTMLVMEN